MRRWLILGMFLSLFSACNYFDTEKVTTEALFDAEIQEIDWSEVDQYPLFPDCKEGVAKEQQHDCFVTAVRSHLSAMLQRENLHTSHTVSDTLWVVFEVDEKGNLSGVDVAMDSVLVAEFPRLTKRILTSFDTLQPAAPAYKRGIPVKTKFSIPVVFATK